MILEVADAHQYCSPPASALCFATFRNTGSTALRTIGTMPLRDGALRAILGNIA